MASKLNMRNTTLCYIEQDGAYLMLHRVKKENDLNHDKWIGIGGKFEEGESPEDCLLRETREETGLVVIPETVKEYGLVHRIQKSDSDPTEVFIQDNYYYLCDAEETVVSQHLDGYESKEDYQLEFVDPDAAIEKNSRDIHGPYNPMMFQREAKVLNMLIAEGRLGSRQDDQ